MHTTETDTPTPTPTPTPTAESVSALAEGVFEHLPGAALVLDPDTTRVVLANRACRALIESVAGSSSAVVGRAFDEIAVGERDQLLGDLRVAAGSGHLPIRLAASGEPFPCWYKVTVVRAGDRRYWLVTLQRTNPSAKSFNAVDRRVSEENERTIHRANRRLREVEARLTVANSDLEHFAYITTHDLRGPCRRQLMLIHLLREEHGDDITPELSNQLDMLTEQAEAMLKMIQGFQFLANLAGTEIEAATIDLPELVNGIVDELLADDDSAKVTIDLPATVRGYPPLIEMLFRNLVGNALKHGKQPMDLTMTSSVENGVTVFSVVNAAVTADVADNPDLLKPFVQGNRQVEGSGLGLSICKRVVQRHQGDLWLEHSPTSFGVHFKLEPTRH